MKTKCAYLGCQKEGKFLDDVEIAPCVICKKLVCKTHLEQLTGNVMEAGKFSLSYMLSKESD